VTFTWKSHGRPTSRLPFMDPATTERIPAPQAMLDVGRDRDSLELPFTRAADASAETAWNSALNWSVDSKEEKEP